MACKDCEARRKMARDALFKAKIGEASGHVVTGAAEAAGIKEKTGAAELAKTETASPKRKRK